MASSSFYGTGVELIKQPAFIVLTVIFLGILAIAACTAPTPPPTPTATPKATSAATLTSSPTTTPLQPEEIAGTQSAAHFQTQMAGFTATAAAIPTLTPTITPTPVPTRIVSLTNQNPSFEELENFLGTSLREDLSGGKNFDVELFFSDVTGNGLEDLIVLHPPEFFVLDWTGTEYLLIFQFDGGCSTRCFPSSSIDFFDWTSDGVPEITFTNRLISGGTGLWVYWDEQGIFHCAGKSCGLIWEGTVQSNTDDYSVSVLGRQHTELTPTLITDLPALRAIASGIYIGNTVFSEVQPPEGVEYTYVAVHPVVENLYIWNGESFEPYSVEELEPARLFDSFGNHAAAGSAGVNAKVDFLEDPLNYYDMNYSCQLSIASVAQDEPFDCKSDFTDLFWQDVTGDGVEEIIVHFLFGSDASLDTNCAVQQRMLVFSYDGLSATKIADAAGCVIQSDLYGVRLEDIDSDGVPEIRAAEVNFSIPERIYKFDGSAFVEWLPPE